jgi:hypothetical protein
MSRLALRHGNLTATSSSNLAQSSCALGQHHHNYVIFLDVSEVHALHWTDSVPADVERDLHAPLVISAGYKHDPNIDLVCA